MGEKIEILHQQKFLADEVVGDRKIWPTKKFGHNLRPPWRICDLVKKQKRYRHLKLGNSKILKMVVGPPLWKWNGLSDRVVLAWEQFKTNENHFKEKINLKNEFSLPPTKEKLTSALQVQRKPSKNIYLVSRARNFWIVHLKNMVVLSPEFILFGKFAKNTSPDLQRHAWCLVSCV